MPRFRWWCGEMTVALATVACVAGEVAPISSTASAGLGREDIGSSRVVYQAPVNPHELLEIDDAMREFFARHIRRTSSEDERLHQLVSAIMRPDGLNLVYDSSATFDARETFHRRRGNCASYSLLVVAVAREFGFKAVFQNTDRVVRWTRVNDLVAVVRHLNVRLTTAAHVYVADLQPELIPRSAGAMRVIRDETAYAQFYCNIAFEHLVKGRTEEALRYLTLAVAIDPGYAGGWTNRALLQARMGDLAAARSDFERALRADRRNEQALEGYSRVLRQLGAPADLARAEQLERKVQKIRARNPFYQHHLASHAIARGDFEAAENYLRRAIALKRDEPEFYAQWVSILEQLGRNADARRAAQRLDKLRAALATEPVPFAW